MKVILFVVDPFACVVYLAKSCSQFATKLAGLPTKYTSSLLVAEMRSYILSEELGSSTYPKWDSMVHGSSRTMGFERQGFSSFFAKFLTLVFDNNDFCKFYIAFTKLHLEKLLEIA